MTDEVKSQEPDLTSTQGVPAQECNRDNMLAWIHALEQETYPQGANALGLEPRDDSPARYCCLGVACEVATAAGLELNRVARSGQFFYGTRDESVKADAGFLEGESGVALPAKVATWLGIEEADPLLLLPSQHTCLGHPHGLTCVGANDGHHMTFPQIALLLRARYNLWEQCS